MARKKPPITTHIRKGDILYMRKSGRPGLPPLRSVIRILTADNYNGIFSFENVLIRGREGGGVVHASVSKFDEKRAKNFQWRFGYNEMNKYSKPSSRVKANIIKTLFTAGRVNIN